MTHDIDQDEDRSENLDSIHTDDMPEIAARIPAYAPYCALAIERERFYLCGRCAEAVAIDRRMDRLYQQLPAALQW